MLLQLVRRCHGDHGRYVVVHRPVFASVGSTVLEVVQIGRGLLRFVAQVDESERALGFRVRWRGYEASPHLIVALLALPFAR